MKDRKEAIEFCKKYEGAYEDYPFKDANWTVMRHKTGNKVFAWIFEKDGNTWINLKCSPDSRDFFRNIYKSVIPAYHLNKEHWNSVILDGSVPEKDIKFMIDESYELTKIKKKFKLKSSKECTQP